MEGIGLEQISVLDQLFLILTLHVENWECLNASSILKAIGINLYWTIFGFNLL
jgi:hypothetical protein